MIYYLNQGINVTKFPTTCHFSLVDSNNASDTFVGGSYMMVSTEGLAVTRSLEAASATQVQTTISSTSPTNTAGSLSPSSAVATSLPSSLAAIENHKTTNLHGGILAVTIILIVLGAAALIFFGGWMLRKSKAKKQMLSPSADEQIKHETVSSPIYEVQSDLKAVELYGSSAPVPSSQSKYELEGSVMEKEGSKVTTTTQSIGHN